MERHVTSGFGSAVDFPRISTPTETETTTETVHRVTMDIANYVRLLEEENRNLKSELFALRTTVALLPPAPQARSLPVTGVRPQYSMEGGHGGGGHVGGDQEASLQRTGLNSGSGMRDQSAEAATPYNKLLKALYPAINSMHPRQRGITDASVRGFLSAHLDVVHEVNGRPAVPKHLESCFIAWFVAQNDKEQEKLVSGTTSAAQEDQARTTSAAQKDQAGGTAKGEKEAAVPAETVAVAWTDFIRYKLPDMELTAAHCVFTKKFCEAHNLVNIRVRSRSGQYTQAIPVNLTDVYLAEFTARYGTNTPTSSETSSSSSGTPFSAASSLTSSPTSSPTSSSISSPGISAVTLSRPLKRQRGASNVTGSYWTEAVKAYDPAWFQGLQGTERERIRGKLQALLIQEGCWKGSFYVPAHLYHTFMQEVAHFRNNMERAPGLEAGKASDRNGGDVGWEEEVVGEGSVIVPCDVST